MSKMEKREELSRYDSMSTEELQEILRKHARGEQDTEPDTQKLFEIMEVLSERRQKTDPQAFRSDEEAFAEFCEHYMPKEKEAVKPKAIRFPKRALKAVAAVLAVVLILAVGASITAEALHIDLLGKFAAWTKEVFQFTDTPQGSVTANSDKEFNLELESLQEALTMENITEKLAPTWMPEGYKYKSLQIYTSPRSRNIYAVYEKDGSELIIKICQTIGESAALTEKDDRFLEIYVTGGVEYYIFSNNAILQAVWSIGEFECRISGKITLEEMKAMIDSI